jgi:hypothetical protein
MVQGSLAPSPIGIILESIERICLHNPSISLKFLGGDNLWSSNYLVLYHMYLPCREKGTP